MGRRRLSGRRSRRRADAGPLAGRLGVLRCTAEFDNSADNPANPDPTATVRYGPQSTDEMCVGYFEVVLADQDLRAQAPPTSRRPNLAVFGAVLILALILVWKRWPKSGQ